MGGTNKSDLRGLNKGFTSLIHRAASRLPVRHFPARRWRILYTMPANYAANNAVQVFAASQLHDITFTTPTAATALSFLGSSGFGTSTVNYTVHHADSSTETGTIAVLDWFDNAGTVAYRPGGQFLPMALICRSSTTGRTSHACSRLMSRRHTTRPVP